MAAINWGYAINKPRVIDIDSNNLRKSDEILREMPELQTCIGCGGCRSGNGCVFGGVVNEAIEKAKTADAFVFGTPVHYASASGNMTSFMDRLAYAGGRYLAYKPAAICCSARRAGTTSTLDQLVKYPEFFHMPLVSGSYWPMVHGSNPEQVLQDAEGCAVMQELGRNMAWLLKSIDAGKAHGILAPAAEPKTRTNFIRKCEPVKKEDEEKNFAPYFISYNKVNKEYQEEE